MLQVSNMNNAELLQYKSYLQKYVFAGWEAPDDLKEWVRLLERHILHADMQAEEEEDVMTDDDGDVSHPATNGTDGHLDCSANCLLTIHAYHDALQLSHDLQSCMNRHSISCFHGYYLETKCEQSSTTLCSARHAL